MKTMQLAATALVLISQCYSFELSGQYLQPVKITAGGVSGQGVLRQRGQSCFAVIPGHLVLGIRFATVITGRGERIRAEVAKRNNIGAALQLSSVPADGCERWKGVRGNEIRKLSQNPGADFRYRWVNSSNVVETLPLRIVSVYPLKDSVVATLASPGSRFPEGASGGQLISERTVIGLLNTVNGNQGVFTLLDVIDSDLHDVFPTDPVTVNGLEIGFVRRIDRDYQGFRIRYALATGHAYQPFVDAQYLRSFGSKFRLQGNSTDGGPSVDDTASAESFSLTAGIQLYIPAPFQDGFFGVYTGAVVQRESTEAHRLRYVESWNFGVALGTNVTKQFNDHIALHVGAELQFLQIAPTREVKVQLVDRQFTAVQLRVGTTYLIP